MFTHIALNQGFSYSNNKATQNWKFYIQVVLFIFVGCTVFGQKNNPRIDIGKLYNSNLEKHLFPPVDSIVSQEIILFLVKPSFEPEYSLRIVNRDNHFFIEGRLLTKSLWDEFTLHINNHDEKPISLEVSFFSKEVSNNFVNRMEMAFISLINHKRSFDEIYVASVDGITYLFKINNKKERVSSKEVNNPKAGTVEDNMAVYCNRIVGELKNQTFDESNYYDLFK